MNNNIIELNKEKEIEAVLEIFKSGDVRSDAYSKMWKHFSAYINVENLTDRRQTRWDTIYTGTIANPIFKDIYTPLDGAVFNAGVKIKL